MKLYFFVFVFLFGCSKSKDAKPSNPLAGKTVVFVGDSITTGYMASSPDKRWTSVFSSAVGCIENNLGVIGEVLQNGVNCSQHPVFDSTTIPVKTSVQAILVIALGMNDVGMRNGVMTPDAYQSTLSNVIDYATTTRGWSKSQIVIVTPSYTVAYDYFGGCSIIGSFDDGRLKAYVAAALAAASSKGCLSSNFYDPMATASSPASLLSSDGLHPNDTGYAFLASIFEQIDFSGI